MSKQECYERSSTEPTANRINRSDTTRTIANDEKKSIDDSAKANGDNNFGITQNIGEFAHQTNISIKVEPELHIEDYGEDYEEVESNTKKTKVKCERFTCDLCSKQFISKSSLLVHLRIHTGEKPYKCTLCSKRFSRVDTLRDHERAAHTGKKLSCKFCSKEFTRKEYVIRHERLHTGEKPYTCSYCLECFRQKPHLKRHEQTHNAVKHLKCDQCTKVFTDKLNFKRHYLIHIGKKSFACDFCDKAFFHKPSLKRHLIRSCVQYSSASCVDTLQ